MIKPSFVFFGTSHYSIIVLDRLQKAGFMPSLIVATPDKPQGRKLILTPPPTKVWALEHEIPVIQPEKLKDPTVVSQLQAVHADVFIVVAYGKIIPQEIIALPAHGTLNIHASLLPKYRGASPVESAILADDRDTGVTLMLIDAEMDHGPIIAQRTVSLPKWPPEAQELGDALVSAGADILIETLPRWIRGKIEAKPQDHKKATYARKIEKEDGLIDLAGDPYQNYLKIQAFAKWPIAYFFVERNGKKIRVNIKKARYTDGKLEILRIIPEGKREMDFKDFMRSI